MIIRSYAETRKDILLTNLQIYQNSTVSKRKIIAVFKADGYGHGDQKDVASNYKIKGQ